MLTKQSDDDWDYVWQIIPGEAPLLKLRGDTIARTESIASLNAANQEAYRQGLVSLA